MKKARLFAGLLALAVGLPAMAATLALSPEVDLLVVDGKKVSGSLLKSADSLELSAGEHQLLFRVSKVVKSGQHDQFIYHSSPQIAVFDTQNHKKISIKLPTLASDRDGRRFDTHRDYQILDEQQQPLPLRRDTLQVPGLSLMADLEHVMAGYNAGKHPASLPALAIQPQEAPAALPVVVGNVNQKTVTLQGENVTEQMLQYWFQQADHTTQARFLSWAEQHRATAK